MTGFQLVLLTFATLASCLALIFVGVSMGYIDKIDSLDRRTRELKESVGDSTRLSEAIGVKLYESIQAANVNGAAFAEAHAKHTSRLEALEKATGFAQSIPALSQAVTLVGDKIDEIDHDLDDLDARLKALESLFAMPVPSNGSGSADYLETIRIDARYVGQPE